MSRGFNVPPVVFPSGGNPNTGPQQRRLPTPPFQPSRSANAGIPFMSFDIGSSPASTSFSTPQFGNTNNGGGNANFDDEPPLLEELDIVGIFWEIAAFGQNDGEAQRARTSSFNIYTISAHVRFVEDYCNYKKWLYERIDGKVSGGERQRMQQFGYKPDSDTHWSLISTLSRFSDQGKDDGSCNFLSKLLFESGFKFLSKPRRF